MINRRFWEGKKVFITGHTGFKGSWLSLWLHSLGAKVTGYALEPPTTSSLFELCQLNELVHSIIGDIRDKEKLERALISANPDIVIHMAAQPLVRESYVFPVETYEINVMGTVNVLEAVRKSSNVRVFLNVTTDKVYENKEWPWGYRETDVLGGFDPYSSSKACSELVTNAYRNSFFHPSKYYEHGVAIATARAGNVIGGGDWAKDRLIPDIIRSVLNNETLVIRNPHAIRPWQHVLEPLGGYLMLAEKLYNEGTKYSSAWNFGPDASDQKTVEWIVKQFSMKLDLNYIIDNNEDIYETNFLRLDCSKAINYLGWYPKRNLETAIDLIIEWYLAYKEKTTSLKDIMLEQIYR